MLDQARLDELGIPRVSTVGVVKSHLRLECSSLLVRHGQFSKLDGTLLMTPYRPVKNSEDVRELLQAISENSQLPMDERCPHA